MSVHNLNSNAVMPHKLSLSSRFNLYKAILFCHQDMDSRRSQVKGTSGRSMGE